MPSKRDYVDVEYPAGLHVADTILWLDAPRRADLCFLSHADQHPVGPHSKVILTRETAELAGTKLGDVKPLVTPYYRRFSIGGLDLQLSPSGYLPGAAQIRVWRSGCELVYTSDFTTGPLQTSEPAAILETDVLVMKATHGLAHQVFPPREEVERDLCRWVLESLDAGHDAIVFATEPGTAQEALKLLGKSGLVPRAQRSVYRLYKKYKALGIDMPRVHRFDGPAAEPVAIVMPWRLRDSKSLARLEKPRRALVSGLATDPGAPASLGVDAAFALSSHADHDTLVRYAFESSARKIHLVGQTADSLAAELQGRGLDAATLKSPRQLELFDSRRNTYR